MKKSSMFKLKKSALMNKNGKWYYKQKLFSGVLFDEDGDYIDAFYVEKGVKGQKYSNSYIDKAGFEVGFNKLLAKGRPQAKYKGKPLNGVTYDFEKEYCSQERLYVDGIVVITIKNYPDGSLKSYTWHMYDTGAEFDFDETGKTKRLYIKKTKDVNLSLLLGENNRISHLYINGDFFSTKNNMIDKVPFPIITKAQLRHYTFDETVYMQGSGITSKMLSAMLSNGGFDDTVRVAARNVSFSPAVVKKFGKLTRLESLSISDLQGNLAAGMALLHKNRPEVSVRYEFVLE